MNTTYIVPRIFASILIFVSIFVFPWWATAALLAIAIVLFSSYYEVLPLSFLFGTFSGENWLTPLIFSAAAGALLFIFMLIKRRLIWNT